jgi:hypothetical protein
MLAAAVVVLALAIPVSLQAVPNDGTPRLDDHIGATDGPTVRRLCNVSDWRNPRIALVQDGIELRAASLRSPRVVALDGLQRALAELPVSDWPHGRIVAVPARASLTAEQNETMRPVLRAVSGLRAGWWTPHPCEGAR